MPMEDVGQKEKVSAFAFFCNMIVGNFKKLLVLALKQLSKIKVMVLLGLLIFFLCLIFIFPI